ncbi:hypothetical protein GCM10009122_16560 [Fulvivirga kasyanovii]|uniref:Uncharacterized protein n=1 Tax=Fulvivirga kasyanovii TaxID=396812 RepID=A0ABW9RM23_9BACT|nr:hypothetical protein [Fulvivirga kasyanovii]MTI24996.1 hypothetical protein [Fulvivirga kasyanovii]
MNLNKNESLLVKSESEVVVLTTHRIRYQDDKELISIMLKQVSGIEVKYTSHPILIILAIISAIAAVVSLGNLAGHLSVLLLITAGVLIALFFSSRKHVVTILSASSRLVFHTKGMGKQTVENFVDKVEAAIAEL